MDYQNTGNDYQITEMIVVSDNLCRFSVLLGCHPLAWRHAGDGLEVAVHSKKLCPNDLQKSKIVYCDNRNLQKNSLVE